MQALAYLGSAGAVLLGSQRSAPRPGGYRFDGIGRERRSSAGVGDYGSAERKAMTKAPAL